MHLISALVAGIRGAENGTAEIYTRGTTNRATRYADFEATQPVTNPSGPVELDSNGAVEVYVNQLVDVVVSDENGAEVRRFTAGEGAPGVEVISQSFKGTDYGTGQQAASKPLPLSTALDRLKTSFGAIDFNVLFNGASTTLQAALASVSNLVFNVKTYGAVGNGTADDTSAIQAAATACNVAGGGIVFFPPGTYSHTGFSITSKVSLMGAGSVSVLALNHASNNAVSWSAVTAANRPSIEGLRFTILQTNTGSTLNISVAGLVLKIDRCVFDAGAFDMNGGNYVKESAGVTCALWITRTRFSSSAGLSKSIYAINCPLYVAFCEFVSSSTSFGCTHVSMSAGGGAVIANTFDNSSAASGNIYTIATSARSSGITYVAGNQINAGGGATVHFDLSDAVDVGNSYPSTIAFSHVVSTPGATTNQAVALSAERTIRRVTIGGATASYTCPDDCGTLIVEVTSSASPITVTVPSPAIGRRGRIYFLNNSGGNRTLQPVAPGGTTAIGGGTGAVVTGTGFGFVVEWEYFRSVSGNTRLLIAQANGDPGFFAI